MRTEGQPVAACRHAEVVSDLPGRARGLEAEAARRTSRRDCSRVRPHGDGRKVGLWQASPAVVDASQDQLVGEARTEGCGPGEPRRVYGLGKPGATRRECVRAREPIAGLDPGLAVTIVM